jgi:pimeloyl-ACP methyl ester carboxylesterase
MPDFLFVHEGGHGKWQWEGVWGYLENARRSREALRHPTFLGWRQVLPDLPGHGPRFSPDSLQAPSADLCTQALVDAALQHGLRRPVLVAHGLTAALALRASRMLKEGPTRLVLIAGVVPAPGRTPLQALPRVVRLALWAQGVLPAPKGYVRLHREFVVKVLASDMDYPRAAALVAKRLTPLPLAPFRHPLPAEALSPPCPVTYVVLTRDRFYPPSLQRQAAGRLGAEVVEVEAGHEAPLSRPEAIGEVLLRWG